MGRPIAVLARRAVALKKNKKRRCVAQKVVAPVPEESEESCTTESLPKFHLSPRDFVSEPRVNFADGEPLRKKRRVVSSVSFAVVDDDVSVEPEVHADVRKDSEENGTQPDGSAERMSKLEVLIPTEKSGGSGETMGELSDLFGSAELCPRTVRSLDVTDDILHGLFKSHKSSRVNSIELTDDVFCGLFKSKEGLNVKKVLDSSLERTDDIFHGLFSAEDVAKAKQNVGSSLERTENLFHGLFNSREATSDNVGSFEKTDDLFHSLFQSKESVGSAECPDEKVASSEKLNVELPKDKKKDEDVSSDDAQFFQYQKTCNNITTYVQETDALIELLVQSLKEKTERIAFLERALRAVTW